MASIAKRPDGKFRARYYDEHGKQHARHFTRKTDAQRWLNEVTTSVVTGQYVDPMAGRVTFRAYYKQWRELQLWAPGTRRAMDLAVNSATFADVQVGSIKRSHVEHTVKTLADRLAPGTVKTRFNNVRAVFRGAVADKIIACDPTDGVKLPRTDKREAAMILPTPVEVARLLDSAGPTFRAFVALAAFAGLRLGEIAGLRVSDINFLGRTLYVERQIQRENGGSVEVRAPKYGSKRTVYLPTDLLTIVSQHITANAPGNDPDRWLFPGEAEWPWHQNTVGYWWRRTRDASAVASTMTLHDLRHFYASGLIAAGCDVVTVQRALGHSNATTTLNTYAHLWPTAEDRTRTAAAGLMRSALDLDPQVRDLTGTNDAP